MNELSRICIFLKSIEGLRVQKFGEIELHCNFNCVEILIGYTLFLKGSCSRLASCTTFHFNDKDIILGGFWSIQLKVLHFVVFDQLEKETIDS
jgi:hypothetical protein